MAKTMNREHFEISAFCILAIHLLQASFLHIFFKNLPDPVFSVTPIPAYSGMKYVGISSCNVVFTPCYYAFLFEHTANFIHKPSWYNAYASVFCFSVFCRKIDRASIKI